jgi:hypothetical protein
MTGLLALGFTAAEKHREALRELAMRRRLYPHWIEKGTITAKDAAQRIAIMEAIVADYKQQERLL